ncbi:MAG: S8 family serine peptidase, partial [Bacteroidota bacterium]
MNKKALLFLPFFLFTFLTLSAQQYDLLLKGGTIVPEENVRDFISHASIESSEIFDGHFYRLLQFERIPTSQEHAAIAQSGVQLLEYLPHLTYIAAIPANLNLQELVNINVRSVMPIDKALKTDQSLLEEEYGNWAIHKGKIGVSLKYHKNLQEQQLLPRFVADGITVVKSNGINNFIYAHIDRDRIDDIVALPYVAYLALEEAPGVPEDTEGRSLHRSNTLDTSFPGGRQYTGEGVGVMVRDDGDIGPHIDFQGRLNSEFVDGLGGTHGDGVSGIMCGAGNLNPRNRGMAAGADLYALEYEATFLDNTLPLQIDRNILVTNSSYSNGCNTGYTNTTATVDQQMNDFPTFLHVFSAGNSNNNECGYGAGDQWGNITGGHKQGKNVIATANVFADGSLVGSSSRGPAHDGRIKPDIAANGQNQISTDPDNSYSPFGGTSGAAPGIAGIAAQLHQAYRELNGGDTAEGALIKAVMMNSANDYGNVGPDFRFGWGIVNAYRAALTLEENRYFSGTVEPGQITTHTIEIPAGVRQVKVMTYWREREATVTTSKSLINNIDTRLLGSGTTYLPWLLDPTPDPSLLNLPAGKGIDDLNNVEQVAIDNPASGSYTLEVVGTELPFGAHNYFVVYEFLTEQHTLTYPIGGEAFTPGSLERIHWDAYGDEGNFILVYSTDGGNSWQQITQVPGDRRMHDWVVPAEFTGRA